MKIAVANWSRRRAGGVETYLADVIPALQRSGHEIALISEFDEPGDLELIAKDEVSLDVCTQIMGMESPFAALSEWKPDVIYAHQFRSLDFERRVSATAPVVAFAHSYFGTCISGSKTHRLPGLMSCSRELGPGCLALYFPRRCGGLNPFTMMRLYGEQTARLEQIRSYFRVVTFSDHMAREYERHGIRASKLWSENAPPSHETGIPRHSPRPGEPWHFAFVGRFELLKGIFVLLEAVSILAGETGQRIALRLVGDGSERARVEVKAAAISASRENLSIEILGWLTGEQLEREWQRAHAVVMPSIWPEPFGLAGIEAGRRKLPVVAFAVGAIPEWLEDGVNGILVNMRGNSARNLAQGLLRLMSDPGFYSVLSAEAPRHAARFSMDRHIEPLEAVLELAAHSEMTGSS